jgi:hypothetical protein
LDGTAAVGVAEGVNDEGRSSGSETSHNSDGGSDGETHLEEGR